MSAKEPEIFIITLHGGRELIIKEKYLRKYARYRTPDVFHGVYNDEAADECEIWIEKTDSAEEKIITHIHEILHFVGDVAEELDDPSDFDTLARHIYQLCKQDYVNRGEENE